MYAVKFKSHGEWKIGDSRHVDIRLANILRDCLLSEGIEAETVCVDNTVSETL